MLAWASVYATSCPQRPVAGSCKFIADRPTRFVCQEGGLATSLLIHWADLDVVRTAKLGDQLEVSAGQVAHFVWAEPIWLVHGERDIVLPTVTEPESIWVGVPTGGLGIKTPM